MITLDFDFINSKLNDGNMEGSTFSWPAHQKEMMFNRVIFIESILKQLNPTTILETGTNKANFVFLVKSIIPDCKIFTFDIQDWCEDKVNLVKKYFNKDDIYFTKGDTRVTLKQEILKSIKYDLAYVDGGHTYNIALSDLQSCADLNITHILVDDYSMISDVTAAVDDFCKQNKYKILINHTKDERGIVLLIKE